MSEVPLKEIRKALTVDYTVKMYETGQLKKLQQGDKIMQEVIEFIESVEEDSISKVPEDALGYLSGAEMFAVAYKDTTPVAIRIKGENEKGPYDLQFGDPKAFMSIKNVTGGRYKKLRLKKKTRRTKRNRRTLKRK